jgi:chromate transporter
MATAAFLLPAAALMTALAVTYVAASALPDLEPAIRGLTAAVVGVLLATTYRLGKSSFRDPVLLALTLAAFGAGVVFNVNAALIVVAAGLIGLLLFASPARRKEPSSRRQKQAK